MLFELASKDFKNIFVMVYNLLSKNSVHECPALPYNEKKSKFQVSKEIPNNGNPFLIYIRNW
jgi:hypothetical protein